MKANKLIWMALAILLGVGTGTAGAATNEVSALLQQGLFEEEANQNLDAAIQAYQSVIAQTEKNRQFAATAIFRLGECYRKQGKTNEAAAQYQRILRDFVDQPELAKLSRQDLLGMGLSAPAISDAALQTQKQLLDEEIKVVEQELQSQQSRVKLGVLPSDELSQTQLKLLELKRQRAALDTGQPYLPQASPEPSDEDKELQRIQAMIKDNPDLINGQYGNSIPLIDAATKNHLAVARFLLDNGADVNIRRQSDGRTALNQAAELGYKGMAELLADRGADVNETRPNYTDRMPPLDLAAKHGFKAVAEVLLAHHADVNVKNQEGKTPLHFAVENGYMGVGLLLISQGADINARTTAGLTPLHDAAAAGNTTVMGWLIGHKAEVNARDNYGRTPLFAAVQAGQIDAASLLLKNQADVNAGTTGGAGDIGKGWEPLHAAIAANYGGLDEMVKLLLENNARTDSRIPLYAFDFNQNRGIAARMSGGNPFQGVENVAPLAMAVMSGRQEVAQLLIEHHADVNDKDSAGDAPLLLAVGINGGNQAGAQPGFVGGGIRGTQSGFGGWGGQPAVPSMGRLEIAELLLNNGADVNAQNNNRDSALSLAVNNNSPELVKLLLAHKPKVDMLDKDGLTPLERAVSQHHSDVAELLLEAGAAPDRKYDVGNNRMSPLELATVSLDKPMVEVLLAHRANPNLPDDNGATPLSEAKMFLTNPETQSKATQIVRLLLDAKANDNLRRISTISVSRAGDEKIAFAEEPNLPNHFSLLDLVTGFYAPPFRNGPPNGMPIQELPGLAFPDFSIIRISRLQKDGRTNVITVNLEKQFDSGDCSPGVPLEWGDIVEIPEADHNINEKWTGLSDQAMATLRKCLAGQVAIMVKGQTNLVTVKPLMYRRNPASNSGGGGGGFGRGETIYYGDQAVGPNGFSFNKPGANPKEQSSFWLYDVVYGANVILTSSDLSQRSKSLELTRQHTNPCRWFLIWGKKIPRTTYGCGTGM